MAQEDVNKNWCDDEQVYSSSQDSDDSPLLSHRSHEKRRYAPHSITTDRERRSTLSVLMKFFLFSMAMISFCVLLYIPVYNRVNDQIAKALVSGWSTHTNRDTKLYVLPNNITTIYEPIHICPKEDINKKNKVLLLIVVCSATENFDRRLAIRNTWGNPKKYIELKKIFFKVKEKYKNYNFTYDLVKTNVSRVKRDASIAKLLPEIAKVLQSNIVAAKTDSVVENRLEDDSVLPEFDMNKELGENTVNNYDYDSETNIMKIPPNSYEESPSLGKILTLLKGDKNFPKIQEEMVASNTEVDFKLAFLLGLPPNRNDAEIQVKIEEEIEKYGDIIQEDFIDSYNNLTLKSIMMLKWINNKCNESVRYILKTDDDMYINVPNLVMNLQNRSKHFDAQTNNDNKKEYLLIGDIISGARPILDSSNKWYSPRYMYNGRVYPKYLCGTAYLFSAAAAKALYDAALRTPYFHLEDIYITGLCSWAASPRLLPRDDAGFSYPTRGVPCAAHAHLKAHKVAPQDMAEIVRVLSDEVAVDRCERIRLTQVRKDKLRPKSQPKKKKKKKVNSYKFIGLKNFL